MHTETLKFRDAKVKSQLSAEKFRDSIRDIRTRESILDKGILDDTGKLKDSVVIGIAKKATEVGDLLKSGATVAQLSPPDQTELESMISKAVIAALQKEPSHVRILMESQKKM